MADLTCDVAIIGGGTAGLAAERSARAGGAATLLIDPVFGGTTCATVGCMPSKLLVTAGNAAHAVRRAGVFGVGAVEPVIDGPAVLARVRRERDHFSAATREAIAAVPDGIAIRASARFTGPTTLALDDGRNVSAKAIVIATGSRPRLPAMFRDLGDLALTNETIFELADLPPSIAVVGAGSIGLELAQAFARLGVRVRVFDEGETIGGCKDEVVAAQLADILRREFDLTLGVKVAAARDADAVRLSWEGATSGEESFARILVAIGRPPALEGLDLARSGLALDDRGTPRFDPDTLRCGDAPVFIAGDADGTRAVLHEASSEGAIAGRNAAAFPRVTPARRSVPFAIMFTDPPLATVGRPLEVGMAVGCASYADQGRARVMACNAGVARLYADPANGRLVGGCLFGPGMDHIGHLIAWSIERGETATDLLDRPFYHPTLEEGMKPALREICHVVHAPLPVDRDEGSPSGG